MRMSHEGERATGDRIQYQPDRALPHWLNPLLGGMRCSFMSLSKEIAPDAFGVISVSVAVKPREKPLLSIHDCV